MLAKVYLEITDACDLACAFCPPTARKVEFLSAADFELYLDRLGGQGRELYFHLKGEPLLHPGLGGLLAAAAARGRPVALTTNGTHLAEAAGTLLAAPTLRRLSVSLHSRAGLPGLEEYWLRLEAFLDLHRLTPSFPVSLRLWSRGASGLPPETERLWELLRARYPRAGAWESSSESWRSRELDRGVYLNQAERFDWPGLGLSEIAVRGRCLGLVDQVGVLVDGTVVPCCLDGEGAVRLGNLREASLDRILSSPRARAMREGFQRRELVEPLCRTCGYRTRFD